MSIKNTNSLISVIITNYNGLEHLRKCLVSLSEQTYKNIEIIVVDNNSHDGSINFIRKKFPNVDIIPQNKNLGYAEGNNSGYRSSKGDYILILNNDTVLENNVVSTLLRNLQNNPKIGAVQPMVKLMKNPTKLDSCGSFWTNTGFNYHVGNYKNAKNPIYNKPMAVYSLKGVCMMIPRTVIEKVGLFDSDYWCYFEETDFCHRVWLAGYECWYMPGTVVYHALGGTRLKIHEAFIQYHSFKNRLCSYIKNLGTIEMIKILPLYLILNIGWSFFYLLSFNPLGFIAIYRAFWWNIAHIWSILQKRAHIQSNIRKVKDEFIFSKVRVNPRPIYYWKLIKGLESYNDTI